MKIQLTFRLCIQVVFGFLISVASLNSALAVGNSNSDEISGVNNNTAAKISSPVSYEVSLKRLDYFMDMLSEMESLIGRSTYDLDALLEELEFDIDKITLYVRDEISYDQYSGLLRGTHATLRGKSGNSLDQSLLLATLVKNAGFEARIVQGRLSEGAAKMVLEQEKGGLKNESLAEGAIEGIIRKYSYKLGIDQSLIDQIVSDVNATPEIPNTPEYIETILVARNLQKALIISGIDLSKSGLQLKNLIDEAQQYFWVQYRESNNQAWKNAHTLSIVDSEKKALKPAHVYGEKLPEKLFHRFGVQYFIEQEINGTINEIPLTKEWIRPTANISDFNMNFSILPVSVLEFNNLFQKEYVEDFNDDIFIASFNGKQLENAFDTNGNIIPSSALASSYAQLFATVSNKLNNVTGTLAQIGTTDKIDSKNNAALLAGVKVRYKFISPNGDKRVYERQIYKNLNKNGGISRQQLSALTRVYSFRIATGRETELEAIREQLSNALRLKADLLSEIGERYGKNRASTTSLEIKYWNKHSQIFSIFDSFPNTKNTYRSSPHLLVHHETLGLYGAYIEGIDIVQNVRRNHDVGNSFNTLMLQGVWESITEGSGLIHHKLKNDENENYIIISSFDGLEKYKQKFNRVGLYNASRDLQNSYVLAFNVRDIEHTSAIDTWWRIKLTGESLRILESGEGGDTTEYLTTEEIAKITACVTAAVGGCRSLASWDKVAAYLNVMQKNAKLIDKMVDIANTFFDGVPLTPDMDFSGTTTGAVAISSAVISKTSEQIYKQCIKRKLPRCAKP